MQFLHRFALVCFVIVYWGLTLDIRWHEVNALRSHYFILPHIIIYGGIVGIFLSYFFLRMKGYVVPLIPFTLFPLFSLFDEFWHTMYGVELAGDPMMYWSPAHWPFGLILIFLFYGLYKANIEQNQYARIYSKAFLVVMVVRLVQYLLVPLSPFSIYSELHTIFNIFIPSLTLLIFVTCMKLAGDRSIYLPAALLLGYAAPTLVFFGPTPDIYNTYTGFGLLYVVTFLVLLQEKISLVSMIVLALVSTGYIFFIGLTQTVFTFFNLLSSLIIVVSGTILYFYFDEYLVSRHGEKITKLLG